MSEGTFRLRDLGLVMREDVVGAPGVDVEPLPEKRCRHCGAFDVPARETAAPGTWPALQPALSGRLPEREVAGMPLSRVDLAAHPRQQLFGRVAGQLAVALEAADVEVHA